MRNYKKIITHSEKETFAVAKSLIKTYPSYNVICLYGELGAGKTLFAKGVGESLGIKNIKSPTYTLIREHKKGKKKLIHIDCFRMENENDMLQTGQEDILWDTETIYIIEWAEKIKKILPQKRLDIRIKDLLKRKSDMLKNVISSRNVQTMDEKRELEMKTYREIHITCKG